MESDLRQPAIDLTMTLRELLCHDYTWLKYGELNAPYVNMGWLSISVFILRYRFFRLFFLMRFMRRLHVKGFKRSAAIIRRAIFRSYGADISQKAIIGPGIRLPHPQGIIIGGDAQIMSNVHIGQFCTIGGNLLKKDLLGREYPIIGDEARIMAGAVVVGPVTIGDRSIVGPNSVVIRDVKADTAVSGVPAVPLKVDGQKVASLKEMVNLLESRINNLERKLSQ